MVRPCAPPPHRCRPRRGRLLQEERNRRRRRSRTPTVAPDQAKDDALIARGEAVGQGRRSEAAQAPGRRVGRRVDERDRHHEGARGRDGEGDRGRRASRSRKMVKEARKFDPILDKLDPDTQRQLLLLKFQAQPSPDDPKQAEELAQIATEMTSLYGKGVCTTTEWQGELQGRRVLVEAAPERARARRSCSKTWKTLARRRRSRRARSVREVRRPRERGREGDRLQGRRRRCGRSATTCRPTSSRPRSTGCGTRSSRSTTQLHCYARRKLNAKYGDKVVPKTGPIPAHLLGNMWAQTLGATSIHELEPYQGRRADRRHAGAREEATTRRRW